MARSIIASVDIGSANTRVVIAEFTKGESLPRVIAASSVPTLGVHRGYISDQAKAQESIYKALKEAEASAGVKVKKGIISIGGAGIESVISVGSVVISKADGEVTTFDIEKSMRSAEEDLKLTNRKVLHRIPLSWTLDGKEVIGRPEGMQGIKLETKTLFITNLTQHIDDVINAATSAGLDVIDVCVSSLAAERMTLTERQRIAGCALVSIGAETVTSTVFENNTPISLQVFQIGSNDITNDVALGLKISLEEAESLKVGTILSQYPQKKINEIMEARLIDIFELVDRHLKKIKRSGLLPAGIILIGGGSRLSIADAVARDTLKLPVKIGTLEIASQNKIMPRDSIWFAATGAHLYWQENDQDDSRHFAKESVSAKDFFSNLFRQLMP